MAAARQVSLLPFLSRRTRRRRLFSGALPALAAPREAGGRGLGSGGTGTGFVKGFLRASEANPAVTWCRGSALPLASDAGRQGHGPARRTGAAGGAPRGRRVAEGAGRPAVGLGDGWPVGGEAPARVGEGNRKSRL